jgi:hypothetical protein
VVGGRFYIIGVVIAMKDRNRLYGMDMSMKYMILSVVY